jgi:hypothetical protein
VRPVCSPSSSSRITHPYSNFLFHGHWGTQKTPSGVAARAATKRSCSRQPRAGPGWRVAGTERSRDGRIPAGGIGLRL